MLKKILISSILFPLIVFFSNTVWAVNNLPGNYQIVSGKMPASVNFPKILKMNISLLNLGILESLSTGTYLVFGYYVDNNGKVLYSDHGPFSFYLSDSSSTKRGTTWVADWVMNGATKFTIVSVDETTGQQTDLETLINDLLSNLRLPVSVDVTVPQYAFTGSLNSNHTLNINLAIEIGVTVGGGIIPPGTITLNGSFKTGTPTALPNAATSAPTGRASVSNEIANWVVNIIKKLPLKYVVPAN